MHSKPMATFELPSGERFALLVGGEWDYGPGVPSEVRQMIELSPAWEHEHPVTHALGPYIEAIATLTGAIIIQRLRPDEPPEGVVF